MIIQLVLDIMNDCVIYLYDLFVPTSDVQKHLIIILKCRVISYVYSNYHIHREQLINNYNFVSIAHLNRSLVVARKSKHRRDTDMNTKTHKIIIKNCTNK